MVKSLVLVRHAQAEPYSPVIKDEERELTATGVADASRMGKHLQSLQVKPDLIVASPAYRTTTTAQLLAEQLGYNLSNIKIEPTLYESSMRNLMAVVNQLSETYTQVMIISHNPTLTYLAEYLTHAEIGTVPTCGSLQIQFENISWQQVSGNTGKLVWFEFPGK
ncbi:histidine phosphatase family protein [Rhodocytophaga rosea]|uniref:Histidine phosphatase family protein n=1 Tax=Rhodocytophaga rosea TaxID=2704465 RepID=A0A6C0GR33_9BACT|nr:histidine phosphatase family protein [Rhodocytophaga rosea]QHT70526.1 histidine phosphatase family protein [Rhodocytophaga rosea]